ncbi:MAG: hypothetical protein H6823_01265 [Planctomycetaceae bacterium]|nr:hypothetical protein [Planctomycetaceae bacterium]
MSRSNMSSRKLIVMAFASILPPVVALPLVAQDFRVDTDVYLGNEEETYSEHLTLFRGTVVYDFAVKGPDEITILNLQTGEISLLDVKRKIRADLTTKELLEFSARIKAIGTTNQAEDLVAPKFDVTFDETQGLLELSSRKISYRANGIKPSDPTVAERYREFTDWYARLNSMRPPNPPHFGRLELNSELASRGLLPQDIERTVTHGGLFSKPQKARSHHVVGTAISGSDRRRIDEAGGYLVSFAKVSPAEYMQLGKLAAQ